MIAWPANGHCLVQRLLVSGRDRRGTAAIAALLMIPALASQALAQEPALAETLYQNGRALMAKGRTAEACAKFEESMRLDQATGTLLNLAVCHEALGKIATAWAEFRSAAASAQHDGRADRTDLARAHIDQLEPRLSYLTIVVRNSAQLPGLRITLDGTALKMPAWNVAAPIDPGTHVVEARAPHHQRLSQLLTVNTTPGRLVVTVELTPGTDKDVGAVADAAAAAPEIANVPPAPTTEVPGAPAGRAAGSRTAALVASSVGAGAMVVGAIFGVRAFSKWSQRNAACPNDACSDDGLRYSSEAQTAALTADVALGVGVVALALGGYLFYRARTAAGTVHVEGAATAAAQEPPAESSRPRSQAWNLRLTSLPAAVFGAGVGLDW